MFLDNYVAAKARRQELIQQICDASDEMAEIDRKIPVLYSQALEDDLLRAEENALKESVQECRSCGADWRRRCLPGCTSWQSDWPQRKGLKSWSQSFSNYPDRERGAMVAEFSEKDTIENLKQINERLARIEENIGFVIEILSRHDLK